ncbi:centriolar coiled-coil protein of 110 kDa-like [Thunnus maccoyii]|uniref:centriolar coiled-coil protein of 110 kDa-like n=1 Tax=Thunnus maccoyii TaxID=8240 RepID=UPI001C4D1A2A|nr:centriolar coiled-coil protein of 110 kDa-like [Thunnus maccoyii]XP_042247927.1 centriolar coiled-coil protein of 110 kDa-like [Thunnus maccoyii]XP_042247928.1 centriolar coiled-coil protein of 110 kDa-like [Thunnus maccoyii]XP_042247929.1 centriolar coiled-coil protein of 110 kDa-like [Thunnus maccoyii]XP_042247930.1 centriolar coiled-coil protein of 110 kDa-like [Thunnus maccoyii]
MCGCQEMESYDEFCLRSLAVLQEEGKLRKRTCEPLCSLKARSVIRFHGRAVLSPLLSAEQRNEMCDYRRRAVQLELDMQSKQRNKIFARVQDILDQAQAHKVPSEEADKLPDSKSATVGGYTLITDSPGLARDSGLGLQTSDQTASACPDTAILNGYKAAEEVKVEREEKSEEEEEEEEEEEDISLDSLLKRSREYVKREQSQHGSKVVHTVTRTPPPEMVSEQENKTSSPMGDTGVEFGFSLHHSPNGPPQTQIQHQTLYDPNPQQSASLSPSLTDRYVHLPSPESSISPCAHRRRPRPVSTGNIHISFPIGPADLIPRSPVRSGEGAGIADWGEALSGATRSSDHWGSVGSEGGGGVSRSGNRRSSHCGTSPGREICSPISTSGPSPMGHHDILASGFRRRCHTLDSQLHTYHSGFEHIDRSQERVPRFMAGVTWLAPSRRNPAAPLNQSYEIENPSPSLLRPRVTPDLAQVKLRMEPEDPQVPHNGRITPTVLRNAAEAQGSKTEETQRRAQALEDMQRRLEEEHALQMSLLLAEQEKEQQRLRLELEETERRLKEQECVRPLTGDACRWNRRSVSDSCPAVSPSCLGLSPAQTPAERSPGHSIGFPSPVSSSVSSPSVHPPVYVWGPTWVANKPRARLSLVLTAEQQRALCRIGAITRGFLTRRLLKIDKVKHLRQTIVDTQEFIRSFQTEAPQKRGSFSPQDLSLQERVRAQLRAALYDIHEIFFEMPLEDRLALLQQDRELRAERKLRDMEKAKCPKERGVLSAATQRSLDRKKRVGESPAQARKMQQKPKSPTTNRILRPSQGQNSPVSGQLNRQGSWYRKTPEERVRRSENLKKQHSLG